MQMPCEHTRPFWQALPHAPQFALSLCVLVHVEPQRVGVAVGQAVAHTPPVQVWPLGQTLPQVPQLALSVCVLVQAPPHRLGFAAGQTHPKSVHAWPLAQALPQAWQLAGSVFVLVQVPLQRLGVGSEQGLQLHWCAEGPHWPSERSMAPQMDPPFDGPLQNGWPHRL
jgi:hypothetical protein